LNEKSKGSWTKEEKKGFDILYPAGIVTGSVTIVCQKIFSVFVQEFLCSMSVQLQDSNQLHCQYIKKSKTSFHISQDISLAAE
jgi:hypothetical protein